MKPQVTLVLFTRDMDACLHFYCTWLGFVVAYEWQRPGEERLVRLLQPQHGVQLSLQRPGTDWEEQLVGRQAGRYPYLALHVQGLDDLYQTLHAAKAPFDRELVQTPFGDFAYLTDPDGNKVTLSEYWTESEE